MGSTPTLSRHSLLNSFTFRVEAILDMVTFLILFILDTLKDTLSSCQVPILFIVSKVIPTYFVQSFLKIYNQSEDCMSIVKKIIVLVLFGILAYQLSMIEVELEDKRTKSLNLVY